MAGLQSQETAAGQNSELRSSQQVLSDHNCALQLPPRPLRAPATAAGGHDFPLLGEGTQGRLREISFRPGIRGQANYPLAVRRKEWNYAEVLRRGQKKRHP
jgi:hypothetical protein